MRENSYKTFYSKRIWLNPEDSPSTGSMVCYDGQEIDENGKIYNNQFLKFSDCFTSIRLHKASYDTEGEFIEKLTLIRDELNEFIEHLKSK